MSGRSSLHQSAWIKAVLALELIWTLAGGAIYALRAQKPTVPEVVAWLQTQNTASLPEPERNRAVRELAGRLQELDFAQLEQVRFSHQVGRVYGPLSPAEKARCAELIVPLTIERILEASRKLPQAQRADFIGGAIFNHELEWLLVNPRLPSEVYGRIKADAIRSSIDGLPAGERLRMEQLWEPYRGGRRSIAR